MGDLYFLGSAQYSQKRRHKILPALSARSAVCCYLQQQDYNLTADGLKRVNRPLSSSGIDATLA